MEVNDPSLDPLWDLVQDLGISIHWYAAKLRLPSTEDYLEELRQFIVWAEAHPDIPSVLTHGLNNIHYDKGNFNRFSVPDELLTLLKFPNWHMELMLHLMAGDVEFPPYEPGLLKVVGNLVDEVGADSLVWGSDMPACERTVTYKQSMILFQTQCDFLTDEQRDLIMGGNLSRLYPI
jgi:predicted TIM-barrel fold metal-dependent hydrolase